MTWRSFLCIMYYGIPRSDGLNMKVCFIGHRTIKKTEDCIFALKETVVSLINKGATIFLFGSMSDFDYLAWKVVTEIKEKYPYIKRVYVRSHFQKIDKSYEQYLLKFYEETYFPKKIEKAGKGSYVERNYEMIDNSSFCVFYYNKNYVPTLKPQVNNKLSKAGRKSGTKIAYEYAQRNKKIIINLYK